VGGLRGSDVAYYSTSNGILTDAYISDHKYTISEDLVQDWELMESTITEDGYIIIEAVRSLYTGDTNHDWNITDNSDFYHPGHKLYFSWGDTAFISQRFHIKALSNINLFGSKKI